MNRRLRIPFTKMHGAGNDYVYIYCPDGYVPVEGDGELPAWLADADGAPDVPALARAVSDRHFGIGGDGLVLIFPGDGESDFIMRMYNSDGSEAQMCGNASRCIALYLHEHRLTDRNPVSLSTRAGIKKLHINLSADKRFESVTVDMGSPQLEPEKIPVVPSSMAGEYAVVRMESEVGELEAVAVSMGNPHGVIFLEEGRVADDALVLGAGPALENHPAWPEKTNIEFVRPLKEGVLEMRVWERGTGETLACGTGACAAAVAAMLTGRSGRHTEIRLPGGTLVIDIDPTNGHVYMTGPASTVAEGYYLPSLNPPEP